MRLLIDTHVLIWWVGSPELISQRVRDLLLDRVNDVYVSAVSAWEIALKARLGKLIFDADFLADFDARVGKLSFNPLPVSATQMIRGAQLPSAHKDPFDRMLAGQALCEGATIVTADPAFARCGVPVVW